MISIAKDIIYGFHGFPSILNDLYYIHLFWYFGAGIAYIAYYKNVFIASIHLSLYTHIHICNCIMIHIINKSGIVIYIYVHIFIDFLSYHISFVIWYACYPGPKIYKKFVKYIHNYTDHITTQYSTLAFPRTTSPLSSIGKAEYSQLYIKCQDTVTRSITINHIS